MFVCIKLFCKEVIYRGLEQEKKEIKMRYILNLMFFFGRDSEVSFR